MRKLIAGPNVFICDECVDLCDELIVEEWEEEGQPPREKEPHPGFDFVCKLCNMPASQDECLLVPNRGALCNVCLDEIRSISEE